MSRQAGLYLARRQRGIRAGHTTGLMRTHRFSGASSLPVASIATGTVFPNRAGLVTFSTRIRITANGGQHRGIVFEFGSSTVGCSLWIGDQTIGFHAGASGTADGATALYDRGSELPVGLELELVAAVNVGTGEIRLWGNGEELARSRASNLAFTPATWADTGTGSFASAKNGTVVAVPAASDQAPAGFSVIEPLSVFVHQVPRQFASAHAPRNVRPYTGSISLTGKAPTVTAT